MEMTRRFIMLGAAATAAGAAGTEPAAAADEAAARLRRIIPDTASARRIGRAFLAADPVTPARLEARLLGALALERRALAALGDAALRARAAAQVRADFAAGRTVVLDGWMLARTEALLCAMAAAP